MDVFEEAKQLDRVPIFSKLEQSKLKLLAFTSEQLKFEDKEYLFHFNDPSDSIYLVLSGEIQIVVEHDNGEIEVLYQLGKNVLVGEMGVIAGSPRSASIRVAGTATVLRIEADTFLELLRENSSMSMYVMQDLTQKLSQYVERERLGAVNLA